MSVEETAGEIQLGLNMHPKWLEGGTPEDFLSPLAEVGLRVLEFPLALASHDWPPTDALIQACRALGFRVSFHAPHKGPYNPEGFSGSQRQRIQRLFDPAVGYAAAVAGEDGPTTLVVHGAKAEDDRDALRRDTELFLSWICERAPNLRPALELRVRAPDVIRVGDNKADLLAVVSASGVPGLGICWDLGHDARNGATSPPPGFVERVTHVHVHDLSPRGDDHYPLVFDNARYRHNLRRLYRSGYGGAVILEVNGHFVARIARDWDVPAIDIISESLQRVIEAFSP